MSEKMTQELAEKVLGYKNVIVDQGKIHAKDGAVSTTMSFTPFTDMNHARMLWDKLDVKDKVTVALHFIIGQPFDEVMDAVLNPQILTTTIYNATCC